MDKIDTTLSTQRYLGRFKTKRDIMKEAEKQVGNIASTSRFL